MGGKDSFGKGFVHRQAKRSRPRPRVPQAKQVKQHGHVHLMHGLLAEAINEVENQVWSERSKPCEKVADVIAERQPLARVPQFLQGLLYDVHGINDVLGRKILFPDDVGQRFRLVKENGDFLVHGFEISSRSML